MLNKGYRINSDSCNCGGLARALDWTDVWLITLVDIADRKQSENEVVARVAVGFRGSSNDVLHVGIYGELADVVMNARCGTWPVADGDKQPKRGSIGSVFSDGSVAARHNLIADLAFVGVLVHLAEPVPAIEVIAVRGGLLVVGVHEPVRCSTRPADARLGVPLRRRHGLAL